jgi:hypothetical protein
MQLWGIPERNTAARPLVAEEDSGNTGGDRGRRLPERVGQQGRLYMQPGSRRADRRAWSSPDGFHSTLSSHLAGFDRAGYRRRSGTEIRDGAQLACNPGPARRRMALIGYARVV